jgi:hypothetical protein
MYMAGIKSYIYTRNRAKPAKHGVSGLAYRPIIQSASLQAPQFLVLATAKLHF